MPIGENTRIFFDHLRAEEELQPSDPKKPSIDLLRKEYIEELGSYAKPFSPSIRQENFRAHRIDCGNGIFVPITVYKPSTYQIKHPTIIYFYGAGFWLRVIEFQKPPCTVLAEKTGSVVVFVDYPLAPEHTADQMKEACFKTVLYLSKFAQDLGFSERFILMGYSSGGTLVANMLQQLLDHGVQIEQQVLISPMTDLSLETYRNGIYHDYQKQDQLLPAAVLDSIVETYLPDPAKHTSHIYSPLQSALYRVIPPTLVVVGEYDALRGDGVEYAKKLAAHGADVVLVTCLGQTHNFFSCRKVLEDGVDPVEVITDFMRENGEGKGLQERFI